jgi:nicotinamide-nucleotide adenylyltransferase
MGGEGGKILSMQAVLTSSRRAALASGLEAFLSTSQSSNGGGLTILYSTYPQWPFKPASKVKDPKQQIDIGVLDSSFNPPTLAHRAIAIGPPNLARPKDAPSSTPALKKQYDAHLLLFSCKNADKGTGKKGDATQLQRVEMMELLAKEMEASLKEADGYEPNVAVGIVEPPLIFAKSTLCHEFIDKQRKDAHKEDSASSRPPVRLHWQAGMDTLERVFALRYYPSPDSFRASANHFFEEEGTTLVVASRASDSLPGKSMENDSEEALLQSELVKPWVESGSVAVWQLPKEVQGCSSTTVRNLFQQNEPQLADEESKRKWLLERTPPGIADYLMTEKVYFPVS